MYEGVPRKFPTTVVGSYPKLPPAKEALKRMRKEEITSEEFEKLVDNAIKMVVEDQIETGVDIISDGEQSREDMEVFFAERLKGFKVGHEAGDWVRVIDNIHFRKPVVVEKIEWAGPMTVEDWMVATEYAQGRPVKGIVTGPYTLADWAFNEYYKDRSE